MAELLHTQRFVLPEGHPLPASYDVLTCGRCGCAYADTTVGQHDYDEFYVQFSKYQDKNVSTGAGVQEWDATRMRDTARRLSQYSPGREMRILDIGCANGGLLRELKALGYSYICGVDPSLTCVENTRAFGIEAHVASLSDSLQLGVFDCVVLTGVLEHVQDLHQAMTQIRSTVGTNGMCFAEVPDASRYEQFLFSPFQDFNTEHINLFSHQSLLNLFSTFGFSEESWGQVEILSSPEFPYPDLFGVYRMNGLAAANRNLVNDVTLSPKIRDYIAASRRLMDAVGNHLASALRDDPELIVWGTGQLTYKLLAETVLGKARIVSFVDGNSINHGKVLKGVTIIAPENLKDRNHPILVASLISQKAIAAAIRESLNLPNKLIFLS